MVPERGKGKGKRQGSFRGSDPSAALVPANFHPSSNLLHVTY